MGQIVFRQSAGHGIAANVSNEEWCAIINDRAAAAKGVSRPSPQPAELTVWGLYLGGAREASDSEALENLRISAIVNAASGVCLGTPRGGVPQEDLRVLKLDADDTEEYPLLRNHLHEFDEFLSEAKQSGFKVLVHCYAGMNRSAALCVAYLMQRERLTLVDSVDLLLRKRGYVLQNKGFVKQLVELGRSELLLQ
eukprot:TRINITY_DN12665_c2_g1_i1.p1 TRINITY_DN12665_c2_g1~~TRINITY_DN12665_c2_g1_i1.p1  ORF type:complete len:195 (-),score=43.03 TRINITY_DN12665_c2_g1_i1:83-667(-)